MDGVRARLVRLPVSCTFGVCTYVGVRIYIHIYIHIYIYIYIYIYNVLLVYVSGWSACVFKAHMMLSYVYMYTSIHTYIYIGT